MEHLRRVHDAARVRLEHARLEVRARVALLLLCVCAKGGAADEENLL